MESPRELLPLVVVDEVESVTGLPLAGRTKLTKIVFLFQTRDPGGAQALTGEQAPYSFVPYLFGPFSKQLLDDLEGLNREGLLQIGTRALDSRGFVIEHSYRLSPAGKAFIQSKDVESGFTRRARKFIDRFASMGRFELVDLVHREYPQFSAEK